jgi:hypothetical protein
MRDSEQSHPDKVGKKLSCRFIYTKEEEEEEAQQTIVRIFREFFVTYFGVGSSQVSFSCAV